jgi:hypothetical protein
MNKFIVNQFSLMMKSMMTDEMAPFRGSGWEKDSCINERSTNPKGPQAPHKNNDPS